MPKHFVRLIALMMIMSVLAACGGTTTTTTQTAAPAVTTGTEAEPTTVAEVPTEAATMMPEETMMTGETATMEMEETMTMDETATMAMEGTMMAEETATMEMDETATMEMDDTATATGGTSGGAAVTLPEVDAAAVEGDIITAGSSTVYPLSERMAELFRDEGYAGNITIDSIGSGAGIDRFCVDAESDIANSSRAIEDEEREQCAANGREVVEFRVGTDALTVVMSSENDFVDELTLDQLAQVFSGEARTWADVDASYPAEPIQLFSPGTDSGTFDYFVETVFDEDEARLLNANPQLSENDNVLVQGVEGSPYAIGYFGYAYYQANEGRLKAISIDGVEPTAETAENGEYPISRPLFIYSAENILAEKPQVASFINYYLTNVNDEIEDVGYFPASEEALNEARQNWLDASGQ